MKIRQFSERTRLIIEFGGGVVVAVWSALLFLIGVFEPFELLMYDWRFNIRGERESLQDIVIITIDEESEKALQQRFPWKRSLHAEIIRTLMTYRPKLIVYDVIFQIPTEEAEDKELADALYDAYDEERDMGLVVLAEYLSQEWEKPLQMFADNAGGVGVINLEKDRDDIVRSIRPVIFEPIDAQTMKPHLSLSLETAALYKGGVNNIHFPPPDTIVLSRIQNDTAQEILRVAAPNEKLYINYIGGSHSYPMIPFWKIITGKHETEDINIENSVVFVGATTLTSHDYFLIPFRLPNRRYIELLKKELPKGATLPKTLSTFGIEIHAQAFQTILENSYIRKVPPFWSAFIILCTGTISGILLFKDRGLLINVLILVLSGGLIWGGSQYLFSARNLWVDLAPLEVVIFLNFVVGLGFQRAVALYNRNKVKGAFQQYVSTAVVEEVLKHPEKLHLGGERKFLTVLFSDIRGFTSISEGMESQELVEFLNKYLTEMTEMVLKYYGTLDKYMGDAIMAIYGAPIEQADHPVRACSSALDMMERLRELQSKWRTQGQPLINIGIGINSGMMTVGNMGSEKRFDYTVMGDHVNLGSRLEGTNKQYGTNIIISEYTYNHVKEQFVTRELDLVRVKGKEDPVRIYELVGRSGQADVKIIQGINCFEEGVNAYRNMCWEEAIEKFNQALDLYEEDPPSQLYLKRCQTYQKTPPSEGWDGVYIMTTK